jgi:hypothetical protein
VLGVPCTPTTQCAYSSILVKRKQLAGSPNNPTLSDQTGLLQNRGCGARTCSATIVGNVLHNVPPASAIDSAWYGLYHHRHIVQVFLFTWFLHHSNILTTPSIVAPPTCKHSATTMTMQRVHTTNQTASARTGTYLNDSARKSHCCPFEPMNARKYIFKRQRNFLASGKKSRNRRQAVTYICERCVLHGMCWFSFNQPSAPLSVAHFCYATCYSCKEAWNAIGDSPLCPTSHLPQLSSSVLVYCLLENSLRGFKANPACNLRFSPCMRGGGGEGEERAGACLFL